LNYSIVFFPSIDHSKSAKLPNTQLVLMHSALHATVISITGSLERNNGNRTGQPITK